MALSLKGLLYRIFIDPLTMPIRQGINSLIRPGDNVLDVACGTGALSLSLAAGSRLVTGIDLSEDMIVTARQAAKRMNMGNTSFKVLDATDLSRYSDSSFDAAVTSLSMHQFDHKTALRVLSEMKRVAKRIVIADYNCPIGHGPAGSLAWMIEWIAGGEHYRNFRLYMKSGGLKSLAGEAGLKISGIKIRGQGVFAIMWLTASETNDSIAN